MTCQCLTLLQLTTYMMSLRHYLCVCVCVSVRAHAHYQMVGTIFQHVPRNNTRTHIYLLQRDKPERDKGYKWHRVRARDLFTPTHCFSVRLSTFTIQFSLQVLHPAEDLMPHSHQYSDVQTHTR